MKRQYLAAIFLAAGLAAPALAAEKSTGVGGAAGTVAGVSASKEPKKVAKKKPGAEKSVKVAQIEKPDSGAKSPAKATRRMRGYGN